MTQLWTADVFELSHEGETDLFNIDNNFRCLKSNFSGASYGLTTEAGCFWYDTNSPILTVNDALLKIRKQGNDGWLGVLALAQESNNGLVWFHGDDMSNQEGWVIDTQVVEDRVMALKNHGSGTYTTGRAVDGEDLDIDDHNLSHFHNFAWMPGYDAAVDFPSSVNIINKADPGSWWVYNDGKVGTGWGYLLGKTQDPNIATLTHTPSAGAWRIKAQVGLVIYPDI